MGNDVNEDQLGELWAVRNAAAMTLALSEEQMRRAVRAASIEALVALVETYSPGRSPGPEWTRTFEPLVERLWTWRDDATMEVHGTVFRARGMAWAAVANALAPERGAVVRDQLRHPAWSRLPAFTVA